MERAAVDFLLIADWYQTNAFAAGFHRVAAATWRRGVQCEWLLITSKVT